jgi:hypothetical protein
MAISQKPCGIDYRQDDCRYSQRDRRRLRSASFYGTLGIMSDGELECQVRDDEIIVSLPGSSYSVTYFKPDAAPVLMGRNFPTEDDKRALLTHSEFLAEAWRVAHDKARELGWIV